MIAPRRSRYLSGRLALLLAGLFAFGHAPAQEDVTWRLVPPERLVFIGMREGQIVLELNPAFAPETVTQFRARVEEDFYRGMSFYRVIEGFVAQAGPGSDIPVDEEAQLPAEFERPWDDEALSWTPVQRRDLFAGETGFVDGFPAAREDGRVWLTHCPGAVAIARGNAPDSGAYDFYVVIGQAPRYLDRNLTVFARVIDGMEVVQRIARGPTENNGIIEEDMARSRISRMRLAHQLDDEEQRDYYVMDTNSDGFRDMMEERRNRDHEFFVHTPPEVLDVCQVPVATRVERVSRLTRRIEE